MCLQRFLSAIGEQGCGLEESRGVAIARIAKPSSYSQTSLQLILAKKDLDELDNHSRVGAVVTDGHLDFQVAHKSAAGYIRIMIEVTRLIDAARAGSHRAAAELLPLVYDELRKLAVARMSAENPGDTLQPTALVHEAYLRLVGRADADRWENRGHFFAAAAEAMRRILVDDARRKKRVKHGGDRRRVELDDVAAPDPRTDLLALDFALNRLAVVDPQAARLVELRHFAGLTVLEAAKVLGVSARTADRVWMFARAWLFREVTETAGGQESGTIVA